MVQGVVCVHSLRRGHSINSRPFLIRVSAKIPGASIIEAHKLIGSDTIKADGISTTQYCAGASKLAVGALASAAIYASF